MNAHKAERLSAVVYMNGRRERYDNAAALSRQLQSLSYSLFNVLRHKVPS